jgi:lipopolysaccharide export LptBFGC system permease protein LptF
MNPSVLCAGALAMTAMAGVDLYLGRETFGPLLAASFVLCVLAWAVGVEKALAANRKEE